MVIKCETHLNDPNGNGFFYAGQTIHGQIELKVDHWYVVQGVSISIEGNAHCAWAEDRKGSGIKSKKSHTTVYVGHEIYLNTKTYVVQKSENAIDIILPPGTHIYNFTCTLPPCTPPSIETKLGHIRYEIVVIVEQPKQPNLKFTVQFNVLIPLNLNNIVDTVRQPQFIEKYCKFYNWVAETYPLMLRIILPRTAFAIGEIMTINIDADNLSNIDIKYLKFSIIQNLLYQSDQPLHKSCLVAKRKVKQKSAMLHKFKRVNFDQYIAIPFLPVTDDTSRVICVSYDLEILVVAKGFHNDKKIVVPIIIGNVPLRRKDSLVNTSLIDKMC